MIIGYAHDIMTNTPFRTHVKGRCVQKVNFHVGYWNHGHRLILLTTGWEKLLMPAISKIVYN